MSAEGAALHLAINFEVIECYKCHTLFAIPAETRRRFRNDGGTFYCPNGHGQAYCETELDRQRRRAEQAEISTQSALSRLRSEQARHRLTEYRRRAEKAQHTRTKKRVAAGVCPCCNRSFQNLARHMAGQHPEYAAHSSDRL